MYNLKQLLETSSLHTLWHKVLFLKSENKYCIFKKIYIFYNMTKLNFEKLNISVSECLSLKIKFVTLIVKISVKINLVY